MTKKLIISVAVFLLLATALLPVVAQDPRYSAYWSRYTDNGVYIQGNWNDFYSQTGHTFTHYVVWANNFAAEMGEWSGFGHGWFRVRLNDDMHAGGLKYVSLSVFPDPLTSWCGAVMTVAVNSLSWTAVVFCSYLDGSFTEEIRVPNWNQRDFAIDIRFSLANQQVGEERAYTFAVRFWTIDRNSGLLTLLHEMGTYANAPFEVDGTFNHKLEAHYGFVSPNRGTWTAWFEIFDIGARPDLARQDCTVDIFDLTAISLNFGKALGQNGITWDDWMWLSSCWKADVDRNLAIDIFDLVYITSQFGRTW